MTLTDAINLVRRLNPEVTRDGALTELPPLPSALAKVHRELGGAIGRPVETLLRTRHSRSTGPTKRGFLQAQDALLPIGRLPRNAGDLVFAMENQGSWDWRVKEGAVWSACRDEDLAKPVLVNESLDVFLEGFLLREALFGSRYCVALQTFAIGGVEPLLRDCAVAAGDSTIWLLRDHVLVNYEVDTWWFGSNVCDPMDELRLKL